MNSMILHLSRSAARPLLVLLCSALFAAPALRAAGINHFQAAAGPHNYVVTNHPAVLGHMKLSSWFLSS
ncbi:MAG: hypothetical protein ACO3JL_16525, partial [Myxococcota bacterium]